MKVEIELTDEEARKIRDEHWADFKRVPTMTSMLVTYKVAKALPPDVKVGSKVKWAAETEGRVVVYEVVAIDEGRAWCKHRGPSGGPLYYVFLVKNLEVVQ